MLAAKIGVGLEMPGTAVLPALVRGGAEQQAIATMGQMVIQQGAKPLGTVMVDLQLYVPLFQAPKRVVVLRWECAAGTGVVYASGAIAGDGTVNGISGWTAEDPRLPAPVANVTSLN